MISNIQKNEKKLYIIIISILLAISISLFLLLIYLFMSFYTHEFGHILGGILNDIISGNHIQNYTISNWIPSPFPGLLMPQQTRIVEGNSSGLFIIGGIFTTFFSFWVICIIIMIKFNFKTKNWIALIPLYALITEFVNNNICGTDNPINKPNIICQENGLISFYFNWSFFLLILLFFILIFPLIFYEMPYFIDKIRVLKGHKAEYL